MRKSFAIAASIVIITGAVSYILYTPQIPPSPAKEKAVVYPATPPTATAIPVKTSEKISGGSTISQKSVVPEESSEETAQIFRTTLDKNFNKPTPAPNLSDYDYSIKQPRKQEYHVSPNVSVHNQTVEIKLDQTGDQSVNITTSKQVLLKNKF